MADLAGSDETPFQPVILTFALGNDCQQSMFQSIYNRLLDLLSERATLRHAGDTEQALALFAECDQPTAVLVADPGIMTPKNEEISQKLVHYAAGGGTVIFGGVFSAYASRENLDDFFGHIWDLPWEAGSQHRTTLAMNMEAVEPCLRHELPLAYSQEALFLQGVEKYESWYVPTNESYVESFAPIQGLVVNLEETPVAWTCIGKGYMGYVGDMNAEEGTNAAVLGMLGLLF